jgi:hypothetical protein
MIYIFLNICKHYIIYNIINDPSCPCGCPLEDDIHYLLECPIYTNTRMKLFMNITPYAVLIWKWQQVTYIINVYINIFDEQKWRGKMEETRLSANVW